MAKISIHNSNNYTVTFEDTIKEVGFDKKEVKAKMVRTIAAGEIREVEETKEVKELLKLKGVEKVTAAQIKKIEEAKQA